jgi:hypothetical protein
VGTLSSPHGAVELSADMSGLYMWGSDWTVVGTASSSQPAKACSGVRSSVGLTVATTLGQTGALDAAVRTCSEK